MSSAQRRYLERTGVASVIDDLLIELVRVRPALPWTYCAQRLRELVDDSGLEPEPEEEQSGQPAQPYTPTEEMFGLRPGDDTTAALSHGSEQAAPWPRSWSPQPAAALLRETTTAAPDGASHELNFADTESRAPSVTGGMTTCGSVVSISKHVGLQEHQIQAKFCKGLTGDGLGWTHERAVEKVFRDPESRAFLQDPVLLDALASTLQTQPTSKSISAAHVLDLWFFFNVLQKPELVQLDVSERVQLHAELTASATSGLLVRRQGGTEGCAASPDTRASAQSPGRLPHYPIELPDLLLECETQPQLLQHPVLWQHLLAFRTHAEVVHTAEPRTNALDLEKELYAFATQFKLTADDRRALSDPQSAAMAVAEFPLWKEPQALLLVAQRMRDREEAQADWEAFAAGLRHEDSALAHLNTAVVMWTFVWLLASDGPITDASAERAAACCTHLVQPLVEALVAHPDAASVQSQSVRPLPFRLTFPTEARRDDLPKGSADREAVQRWAAQVAGRASVSRRLECLFHLMHQGWPAPRVSPAVDWWVKHFGKRPYVDIRDVELGLLSSGVVEAESRPTAGLLCPATDDVKQFAPRAVVPGEESRTTLLSPPSPRSGMSSPVTSALAAAVRKAKPAATLRGAVRMRMLLGGGAKHTAPLAAAAPVEGPPSRNYIIRPELRAPLRDILTYSHGRACCVLQWRALVDSVAGGRVGALPAVVLRLAQTNCLLPHHDESRGGKVLGDHSVVVTQVKAAPSTIVALDGGPRGRTVVTHSAEHQRWTCRGWSPQESFPAFVEMYLGSLRGGGNVYPASVSDALSGAEAIPLKVPSARCAIVAADLMQHFRPQASTQECEKLAGQLQEVGGCTPDRLSVTLLPALFHDPPRSPPRAEWIEYARLLWEVHSGRTATRDAGSCNASLFGSHEALPRPAALWVASHAAADPSRPEEFIYRCWEAVASVAAATQGGADELLAKIAAVAKTQPLLRTWVEDDQVRKKAAKKPGAKARKAAK